MKKSARLSALLFFLALATHGQAETKAPALPSFPNADEYTKLRMAFAAQPGYSSFWKGEPGRTAIMTAAEAKHYTKAVELAEAWLVKVPVDAEIHYLCGHFQKKTGDVSGSMYHFRCFYGLMNSLTASGDGKSPKTAYKVISVDEEYCLLNEIDAELLQQTLVEEHCDQMHVRLPNGRETDFYFDVSISMAAMAAQLKAEKK